MFPYRINNVHQVQRLDHGQRVAFLQSCMDSLSTMSILKRCIPFLMIVNLTSPGLSALKTLLFGAQKTLEKVNNINYTVKEKRI